jgi:hypothetical protein
MARLMALKFFSRNRFYGSWLMAGSLLDDESDQIGEVTGPDRCHKVFSRSTKSANIAGWDNGTGK